MQIQEDNESPGHDPQLHLAYSEDYVEVLKEEEAYSFLSLVSDCGGVLGLFVGFNFLMVFNVLDYMFLYCKTSFSNNSSIHLNMLH